MTLVILLLIVQGIVAVWLYRRGWRLTNKQPAPPIVFHQHFGPIPTPPPNGKDEPVSSGPAGPARW